MVAISVFYINISIILNERSYKYRVAEDFITTWRIVYLRKYYNHHYDDNSRLFLNIISDWWNYDVCRGLRAKLVACYKRDAVGTSLPGWRRTHRRDWLIYFRGLFCCFSSLYMGDIAG